MKQSIKQSRDRYQRFLTQCKSLIAKNSNQKPQKNIENNVIMSKIIDFNQKEYPFNNKIDFSVKGYRTSLLISSNFEKIQNFIDIKHPNIINIQKIVKTQRKSLMSKDQDATYNIFYQKIPYSIKYIGFGDETSLRLLAKMGEINIRQILNNLLLYLIKTKINYAIKLIDIGVTESGIIKIYIPPSAVVGQSKKQIDKHQLIQNNQKLITWWETTFIDFDSPEKKEYLGRQQKIKTNPSISSTEQKVNLRLGSCQSGAKKRFSYFKPLEYSKAGIVRSNTNLNSSTKSYGSDFSLATAFQIQKMKKIDQQIKQIKEKIKQKSKNQKRKDSDHMFIDQYRESMKNTSQFNAFQSERLEKKLFNEQSKHNQVKEVGLIGDSIQQNINCINIYNQTPTTYSPNKNCKQSSKNGYNQPGVPYNAKPPTIKNVREIQSSIHVPLNDIQDQNSFDTYDIQLNNEEDTISKVPAYRNTLGLYERQISQRNYKIRKETNKLSKQTKLNQKNQVQNRKFAVESAGPLQFKNFINNIVKPQYLAKKSNIYEDPMQEQSEQSAKKIKVIYKQLAEAGRSVASQTQKSKSTKRMQKEKQKIVKVHQKDKMQRILSANILPVFQKQSYTKQKCFNTHSIPCEQSSKVQMANRVKQIVQRTKNAIQVLNRSKYKSNSNFFRKAISP